MLFSDGLLDLQLFNLTLLLLELGLDLFLLFHDFLVFTKRNQVLLVLSFFESFSSLFILVASLAQSRSFFFQGHSVQLLLPHVTAHTTFLLLESQELVLALRSGSTCRFL